MHRAGNHRWQEITELTQDSMQTWIAEQRQKHGMKNDDATIAVLEALPEEPGH